MEPGQSRGLALLDVPYRNHHTQSCRGSWPRQWARGEQTVGATSKVNHTSIYLFENTFIVVSRCRVVVYYGCRVFARHVRLCVNRKHCARGSRNGSQGSGAMTCSCRVNSAISAARIRSCGCCAAWCAKSAWSGSGTASTAGPSFRVSPGSHSSTARTDFSAPHDRRSPSWV